MSKETILRAARWALCAPGAALAGWLTWAALQAFARVTLWAMNLESETAAGRAYVETLSGLLAGLVFLYLGVKLAPSRRKRVAYVLGGLGLLAAGFVLFPALARADYWTMWNVACAIVGAAVVAATVGDDETETRATPDAARPLTLSLSPAGQGDATAPPSSPRPARAGRGGDPRASAGG
jgi:hypothetical protein